jgi:hypothetical protein
LICSSSTAAAIGGYDGCANSREFLALKQNVSATAASTTAGISPSATSARSTREHASKNSYLIGYQRNAATAVAT